MRHGPCDCRTRGAAAADGQPPVPVAALLDAQLQKCRRRVSPGGHAARSARPGGSASPALDAEGRSQFGLPFASVEGPQQDCTDDADATRRHAADRVAGHAARDILRKARGCMTSCRPTTRIRRAWSEIGFGGPANPRGYVRMDFDQRDPWEAAETEAGHEDKTRRENRHVG